MTNIKIQFKNPDAIFEIINGQHPFPDDADDITPRLEKDRDAFSDKYFEYGDYGCVEINPVTLECKLLPRKDWE